MTETQTHPNCAKCGDTGFIPPFMELCDCPAVHPMLVEVVANPFPLPAPAEGSNISWVKQDAAGNYIEVAPPANADELREAARMRKFKGSPAHHPTANPTLAEVEALLDDEAQVAGDPEPEPPKFKVMSPAQRTLITNLMGQRDPANPMVVVAANTLALTTPVRASNASKLIDKLMAVPKLPGAVDERPNSYKGACKDCGGGVAAGEGVIRKNAAGKWTTFHKAGECLTEAAKAEMEATKVTEPGLYRSTHDGETRIYRVKWNGTKTRMYGEIVIPPEVDEEGVKLREVAFVYDGNAMTFLRSTDKLTWAEARAFGAAYGSCVACGRTLSDNRSLVQGYGPTCAKHYDWPTVTNKVATQIIEGTLTWEAAIAAAGVTTS